MSEKVIPFSAACKPVTPIDDEAIALLRGLLERAEKGDIQGVCVCTIESDGAGSVLSVGSAYAGQGVRQNVHAALGGIEALKLRFARERIEEL